MANPASLKRVGTALLAGLTTSLLVLGPTPALADDIESYGGDIVVTLPQEQSRGISRMSLLAAQTSQRSHLHPSDVLLLHLAPGKPRRIRERHGQDDHVQQGIKQWHLLDHHQDAL